MRRKTRKEKFQAWLSSPYMLLAYRMLATLLALSISRWMLYLFNIQFFHQLSLRQAAVLYFYGMRFDLPIVFAVNLLNILFYCFPARIIYNKGLQKIVDFVYVVANAVAILLNFLDIVAFHFFGKHLTIDFIKLQSGSDEVSFGVVRQVFFDYWYLLVIFILFVLIIRVVAKSTQIQEPEKGKEQERWYLWQSISLVVMLVCTLFASRSIIHAKPISQETTMHFTDPQNAPILFNTPYCLLALQPSELREWTGEYQSDFSPIHKNLTANRFIENDSLNIDTIPSNVVVIILKNVGQEMLGYYSHDRRFQLTPFLDSILGESLTFNGMSNSRRSLEVLPAILASIPSMMENDFVRSPYADNDIDAFCQHLQKHGYNTIFMHGGKNGVQGFDEFSRRAGFSKYFGRIEYGDDSDYDGQWGIYDGPFLQYAVKTLSRIEEPFATAIYTLSARQPYEVP